MTNRLIILPNNPGDVLMGLHAATALKIAFPQDKLGFIVDTECATLIQGSPAVDQCFPLPRSAMRTCTHLTECASLLEQFLDQCIAFAPHTVINLFQGDYGAILSSLIPAQEHFGKLYDPLLGRIVARDPWSQYLLAIPAHRSANNLHVIDIYLRICGITPPEPIRPQLPPVPRSESLLLRQQLPPHPFIAFQPGSAWPGKQWPIPDWIDLGQLIIERTDYHLVIMGSPQESPIANAIASALPAERAVNLCGRTSLLSTQTVLEQAQLLITVDTFTMHMASALRTPVFALFGPSNPVETGPYQPGAQTLQASNTGLRANLAFTDSSALASLSASTVFDCITGNTTPVELRQAYWNGHSLQLYPAPDNQSASNLAQPFPADLAGLSQTAQTLLAKQSQLLQELQRSPHPETLQKLETQERLLAESTDCSLSMEMYRIALNALPSHPLQNHLHERFLLVQQYLAFFKSI